MADAAPPRRRFQFRLRTLMIVVTLLAIPLSWVGWQIKIIKERREAAALYPLYPNPPVSDVKILMTRTPAPWPLRWFGEEGDALIFVPENTSSAEIERLRNLFPEANVQRRMPTRK